MTKFTNVLHIYGQPYWHQCAFIVGDQEALVHLRERIDAALQFYDAGMMGKAESWFEAYTNDGEGYEAHVVCVPTEKAHDLMLPYTDEPGERKQPPEAINPYDLVDHSHRKRKQE